MRRRGLHRVPEAAVFFAMAMALVGCPDERGPVEVVEPTAEIAAKGARAPVSGMAVDVVSVRSDAAIDVEAVRAVLRDAEPAFLACIDPDDSTGVIALKLGIEEDGATLDVTSQQATTYGTDDARACLERIVAALRFPTTQSRERFELAVTLEVRTRHEL
ncbi:hypothetical protein [Polyangium jinanense]|uniref:AgmX/PglI C-terminal domain-containing protein n=1 Tax=Polyangium jinanense TaxID=2829994 RepID=A0A9X4AQT5_9BACT|nr:hypothetical protein [Polyangium jinanense]MDC3953522.1 hypothetical protein [Polyangium jinanense]MDC3979357.1 hypothetical protein [Polyangium jinanense]